jgi:hypothetical protein
LEVGLTLSDSTPKCHCEERSDACPERVEGKQSPPLLAFEDGRLLRCATKKLPLTPALSPMRRGGTSPLPARERVRVRVGRFCLLRMARCAMEDSQ